MAVECDVIEHAPCRKLLRNVAEPARWYEPSEYARLVEAAGQVDRRIEVLVRLGGDAGLRRGEMKRARAMRRRFHPEVLTVRKSVWNGQGFDARLVLWPAAAPNSGLRASAVGLVRCLWSASSARSRAPIRVA